MKEALNATESAISQAHRPPPEMQPDEARTKLPRFNRSIAGGSKRYAWYVTSLLFAFMVVNFADKAVLGLAAGPIKDELGLSDSQYGFAASSFFFLFSIAAVSAGVLSTKFSNRWLLLVMGIVWAVFQLPMLVGAAGFTVLVISRIALGAGEGPAWPTAQNSLCTWFEDRDRGLPSGLLGVGATVGVIIAAPSLTWVVTHIGWRWAFGVMGFIGIAWVGIWFLVGKDGPYALAGKSPNERHSSDKTVGSEKVPTWRLLLSPTWIGCAVGYGTYYWAMVVLSAWVPLYIQKVQGYSVSDSGDLIILPWSLFGLSLIINGLASKPLLKIGLSTRVVRGVFSGIALLIAAIAMFAATRVEIGGVTAMVLLTVAFGAFGPMAANATIAVGEIAPLRRRGLLLGMLTGVTAVSAIVAPMAIGFMVESGPTTAMGYQHGFDLTAVLLLVGAIAGMTLIRPARDLRRWKRIFRDDSETP